MVVKNKHGEKANHVRLSMKDENAPKTNGIEPSFFRKPTSRQEGKKLHLECEIEALPKPEIFWFLGEKQIENSEKYELFRAIQPSNPNIHFVRLTINVRTKHFHFVYLRTKNVWTNRELQMSSTKIRLSSEFLSHTQGIFF